ncbi:21698_t:CDS:1, partial [Gigaspora rosea]
PLFQLASEIISMSGWDCFPLISSIGWSGTSGSSREEFDDPSPGSLGRVNLLISW